MKKAIKILDDTRFYPTVFNVIEGANKVDTAVYTLTNYNVNEHDLSKYGWYAHLFGVEGIDEVELTSEVTDDGLVITFNLNEYITNIGNTLTYQLVAKDSNGAVYYTSKGIMLNSESIQADEFIAANYPSIMKQWLDRMNGLYGEVTEVKDEYLGEMEETRAELERYATDFTNSVFYIPYDETIPVEDRIDGRLYFQYTDGAKTKGRFEDPEGNSLVPEAKGGSSLPMFAPVWSDHLYNDASYLRADNFSWHNSSIYVTGYEKLLKEYNNENSVEETDEKGITYKISPNGFKIADVSQEETILNLYLSDEKAWYYILDTENARFKLPREKKSDGKYLYFFIGSYEREEGEINIGVLTEIANGQSLEEIIQDVDTAKNNAIAEIDNRQIPLNVISETSGVVTLDTNKIYTMDITADTTFSLPEIVDTAFFNQIKVMVLITGNPVITWGTSYFANKTTPELEEGVYDLYFDYDNHLAGWVVGVVSKGLAE